MTRSKTPTPQPAKLSFEAMKAAIPKIERRIAELLAFEPLKMKRRDDPELQALEARLETLITDVFGYGTVEHLRYEGICRLDHASHNMMHGTPLHEVIQSVAESIPTSVAQLRSIVQGFRETLDDAGQGRATHALRAYEGLELHQEIERAAGTLFRSGHYPNAIEDSVKALNALVRLRSGVDDKDGVALMQHVFGASKPILKFNALADESDRNEQIGFMQLFCGAVAGLRNPRAHKLIKDDSERALEFIAFVSLLAKLTDSATR